MTVWRHALGGDLQLTGRAGGVPSGSTVTTWIATNGLDELTRHRGRRSPPRHRSNGCVPRSSVATTSTTPSVDWRRSPTRPCGGRATTGRLRGGHGRHVSAIVVPSRSSARSMPWPLRRGRDPRRHGIPPAALDLAELLAPLGAAAPGRRPDQRTPAGFDLARPTDRRSRPARGTPTSSSELTAGLIRAIDERDYLLATDHADRAGRQRRCSVTCGRGRPGGLAHDARRRSRARLSRHQPIPRRIERRGDHHRRAAPCADGKRRGHRRRPRRPVARLVTISDDDQLNDGTKRGLAASMLTYFPLLAPQLDVRIPVVVPTAPIPTTPSRSVPTATCSACSVSCSPTTPAQLVLGAMTERYRVAETAGLGGCDRRSTRRRRQRAPGPDRRRARRRQCRRRADVALARGAHLARRVRARPRHRTGEGADLVGDRDRCGRRAVVERGAPAAIPIASEVVTAALEPDRAAAVGRPRRRRRSRRSASP